MTLNKSFKASLRAKHLPKDGSEAEIREVRRSSRNKSLTLPLHSLDLKHRGFLSSLQMRICYHVDVGRVLVTERSFNLGETVLSAAIDAHPLLDEKDLKKLVGANLIETGCFIRVPRKKVILFNKKFDINDPVKKDLWYLLNHSSYKANCEIKVADNKLIVQAKRNIKIFEPLTWAYNSDFFDKDEDPICLPSQVIIDLSTLSPSN
jgi:hypothetical protein